jgi:hypothetical protein
MAKLNSTRVYGNLNVDSTTTATGGVVVPTAQATNTIISTDGQVTATKFLGGLDFTTTAPTANNTNGIKIYVGTEPVTKYDGWLYIITS